MLNSQAELLDALRTGADPMAQAARASKSAGFTVERRRVSQAAPAAGDEDPYENVAHWLQEVGHRRVLVGPLKKNPAQEQAAAPRLSGWRTVRESLTLAVLVAAYLQYHLIGDLLQVVMLHSIVVFV